MNRAFAGQVQTVEGQPSIEVGRIVLAVKKSRKHIQKRHGMAIGDGADPLVQLADHPVAHKPGVEIDVDREDTLDNHALRRQFGEDPDHERIVSVRHIVDRQTSRKIVETDRQHQ